MLDWKKATKPIIALAPMADMTDQPFCRICKEIGVPYIWREMVSAEAIIRGNQKTRAMTGISAFERPVIQQLFGNDPERLAEAARIIEEMFQPDGIDINMGCPVRKITENFDGSSLMRDPERAAAIVKAVKNAVKAPVSVKTRLGWSKDDEILTFAKIIEDAGADLLTVHGRTKEQGYAGVANWTRIGQVKDSLSIPVILNGDVTDGTSAKHALELTGADGVMLGRGALGNPWVFNEIGSVIGVPRTSYFVPSLEDRVTIVLRHARYQIERYGEGGLVKLRKHFPFYFKKELHDKHPQVDFIALRSALVRVSSYQELEEALKAVLAQ
ncbi:MAG: tRNA dihydrouridine synthase DusB [Patescibacteria group bacterium]|nr:tRNA dihydrouridine synthase DusB [Patescibacteria group bacterium]